jgi:protein disulfide-isomerase
MAQVRQDRLNKGFFMKRLLSALFALCAAGALMAESAWLTSLPEAQAQAAKQKKLVLLDFTGSDWCPACKMLHDGVFSKKEFGDYAATNLVLVEVDFPASKPQPKDLEAANKALQEKYNINGFPTVILMKPDGTVVLREEGYDEKGPSAFIAKLDEAKKK